MWVTLSISRCKWIAKFTVFSRCARGVSEEVLANLEPKKRKEWMHRFTFSHSASSLTCFLYVVTSNQHLMLHHWFLIVVTHSASCERVCVCFLHILCVCVWSDVFFFFFEGALVYFFVEELRNWKWRLTDHPGLIWCYRKTWVCRSCLYRQSWWLDAC